MEGSTCGPDQCQSSLCVGDECNFIYNMDLGSGKVTHKRDPGNLLNVFWADKCIEALVHAKTTGHFHAGIQDTVTVHAVRLNGVDQEGASADVPADNTTKESEAGDVASCLLYTSPSPRD